MFAFLTALAKLLNSLASLRLDDRTWDLIPAILGGVIGALAGGVPAYALARLASNETVRRDREARLSADIALLYSAAQRLIEITNSLYTICLQFNEQLDAAAVTGNRNLPLHGIIKPMAGIGDEDVRFSTEEIALFFRAEQSDYANELLLISRRHASNMRSLQAYSDRREAFTRDLIPTEFVNGLGTVDLVGEPAMKAKVTAFALDQMADMLLEKFNEDRRTAMALSGRFGEIAKAMYPNSKVPTMTFDPN